MPGLAGLEWGFGVVGGDVDKFWLEEVGVYGRGEEEGEPNCGLVEKRD